MFYLHFPFFITYSENQFPKSFWCFHRVFCCCLFFAPFLICDVNWSKVVLPHPIYIYVFCIALHFTFKKHQISETACIKGRFKHASNETKMFITRVVILKSFLYFFQVFNRYRLLLFKSGNTFEVIKMFWSTEFVLKHILYLEFHKLSSKSKHVVVLSRITLKVTFIDT